MATSPGEQIVFREYPILWWLFGLPFLVSGAVLIKSEHDLVFLALFGAVCISFASILTVTVDHRRGILHLRYRSLVRAWTKSYPLSEISFVNVAEDSERERMYRVELVLRSGDVVPLRTFYSVGRWPKERRAQELRAALGVQTLYL